MPELSDSPVERTRLNSGIRVVTEKMPNVRSVSVGVWLRVGSRDESPSDNGLSHFLEHMVFKGTERRSAREIAASLESRGGNLNGSTGKEITVYNAQVLDEDLSIAIDVLTDLLSRPRLADGDLELEKSVVLAEINHAKEDPEELVIDHFYQQVYPEHPLGYFIYGSADNVLRFRREDLLSFMGRQYLPERMVFAAAGNVDHNRFVELVAEHYTPAMDSGTPGVFSPPANPPATGRITLEFDVLQQAHIATGGRLFGTHDRRKYAMSLLDVLLGGGMSSRLFQNIREKYGFAYNVYSFNDFLTDTGVFGIYMACAPDRVEQAIDLIHEELCILRRQPVSNQELEEVKSQVRGSLILGMESSARRMRKLGETEILDRPHRTISEILDEIERITPEDLRDLAGEFYCESRLCTTVIVPQH